MVERTTTATNISRHSKRCGPYLLNPHEPVVVPLSFIDQYGYDTDIMIDYRNAADLLRGRKSDGTPSFDFWVPVSVIDGYGRHALDIWKGLKDIGCDVALKNAGYFVDNAYVSSMIRNEILGSRRVPPSRASLAMSVPYDPALWRNESLVKIGITQFETDRFPQRHVDAVNNLHHLIVTSSFQPKMMRKSGVQVPISVLTPGIDTNYFRYHDRPRDGLFKVLLLGALTNRKNPIGAIRIWLDAAQGSRDWRLTIKTRNADGINVVRKLASEDYRINFVMEDSRPEQVRDYYHQHDAFLWPSKGEGCGLPPLEAMATGMEVVCSDNSGMSDYLTHENSWKIRMTGMESAHGPGCFSDNYVLEYGEVGNWWVPDEAHGVKQLRKCFEAWSRNEGKGRAGADYVATHHTLGQQARSVLAIMDKYL